MRGPGPLPPSLGILSASSLFSLLISSQGRLWFVLSLRQPRLPLQIFHSIGCSKSTHFLRMAHVSPGGGPPALVPACLFAPQTAATSPQIWPPPSPLIPPRLSLLFFPSQGQHQSECLPLAAPSLTSLPLAGAAPTGRPDRKSPCVFTFCPCTRMPELACTPACMCTPDIASRHAELIHHRGALMEVHDGVFPPEPFG